jgi:transposase
MGDHTTGFSGRAVGLDLGDRYSHYCILSDSGDVEEEGRVATKKELLGRWFTACAPARVVMEVGTHSPWVSRLAEQSGHEVLVANPTKLRMIYQNDSKSDRVDAHWLARVGRMDPELLAPVRHRSVEAQADLGVIRARDTVVRARTQLVNHVRGVVKAYGGRLPSCSTPSFPRKAGGEIPEALLPALGSMMEMISSLTAQIRGYDRRIEEMARDRYPEAAVVGQIHGVGVLTSVAYVLILEDPQRFRRSRAVGAYLGMRPRQKQSGNREPQLRITKGGDEMLRRLLVNSAHHILGYRGEDSDLRRQGLALCARGGKNAKKRAVVAVARKLAVLMHRLWVTGEVYEPLHKVAGKQEEITVGA